MHSLEICLVLQALYKQSWYAW